MKTSSRRILLLGWMLATVWITPGGWPFAAAPSRAALSGIRVEGNRLVDMAGNTVVLHGVNRMSTEYACIQDWGIFSGPSDRQGNEATLAAMSQWHVNAVRVPLNEHCWLDRETTGLNKYPESRGAGYRAAIKEWVGQITGLGMVAIVDLHFSGPKGVRAETQQPMADADNSPDFWRSIAQTFKDNPLVILDLFNEPYLDRDMPPDMNPWACWRDGCTVFVHEGKDQTRTAQQYEAAGMQQLVDAVRSTGASNPIMLGGLNYADRLDGLMAHLPSDPLGQLIAAWHPYPGNDCGLDRPACWNDTVAAVMTRMPVVAGEFGRNDCSAEGLEPFLSWMDQHQGSYLAWVWTVVQSESCPQGDERGDKYDLIVDYETGAPTNPYGSTVRAHYQQH